MFRVVACVLCFLLLTLASATTQATTSSDADPDAGRELHFPAPIEMPRRLPPVEADDLNEDSWEALPLELEGDQAPDPADSPSPKRGGRGSRGGLGGPFGGGNGSPIGYRAFGEPTRPVEGPPTTFEHWGQEIRLTAPAWTADPHLLLVSTSIANDLFDTAAVFPTSGTEFPESLWNIRLGMTYLRTLANDWKTGAGVNIGSASDRPFATIRDMNPALFAFLSIPESNENAWNFSLFYSPLSEIPFPLPGAAYYWHASDSLQMNIGLPAQLTWQPIEQFTFMASYMLLHTINVRGTWQIDENWSAYVAYENRNRAWFLNDRERDDERLFSYDQGALIGLQRNFFKKFRAEIAGGYLFNRFYFIGEDYLDRNQDRINIDSGLTASAQIGAAW